jgi:DDE superfamily endonuclease
VRTWAPKGQTPVIQFHFNWNHVSVIAGLTRTNCLFRLHEGSIRKEEIVEFLKALRAHLKQPLLVIWDGLKAHRSRLVRDYLYSVEPNTRQTNGTSRRLQSSCRISGAPDHFCLSALGELLQDISTSGLKQTIEDFPVVDSG